MYIVNKRLTLIKERKRVAREISLKGALLKRAVFKTKTRYISSSFIVIKIRYIYLVKV